MPYQLIGVHADVPENVAGREIVEGAITGLPHSAMTPAFRSFKLAKNDIGIAQTVLSMQQLIDSGARSPGVRSNAVEIIRRAGVQEKDSHGEVRAVFEWVKANFHFIKDPHGRETLGTADFLLELRAGDCDDYVVVLGALLSSLGYPVKIVTIKADADEPERYSHVYLHVLVDGNWIALDSTQRNSIVGWEPPRYFKRAVWGAMMPGHAHQPLAGLGAYQRVLQRKRGRTGLIGINWEAVEDIFGNPKNIEAITGGTARIISAARTPAPFLSPSAGQAYYQPALTAGGGFNISTPGLSTMPAWAPYAFLLGGGVILLVMLLRRS